MDRNPPSCSRHLEGWKWRGTAGHSIAVLCLYKLELELLPPPLQGREDPMYYGSMAGTSVPYGNARPHPSYIFKGCRKPTWALTPPPHLPGLYLFLNKFSLMCVNRKISYLMILSCLSHLLGELRMGSAPVAVQSRASVLLKEKKKKSSLSRATTPLCSLSLCTCMPPCTNAHSQSTEDTRKTEVPHCAHFLSQKFQWGLPKHRAYFPTDAGSQVPKALSPVCGEGPGPGVFSSSSLIWSHPSSGWRDLFCLSVMPEKDTKEGTYLFLRGWVSCFNCRV